VWEWGKSLALANAFLKSFYYLEIRFGKGGKKMGSGQGKDAHVFAQARADFESGEAVRLKLEEQNQQYRDLCSFAVVTGNAGKREDQKGLLRLNDDCLCRIACFFVWQRHRRAWHAHIKSVTCCQWNPNGATFLTSSADCSLKIWHSASGECMCKMKGHTEIIREACFSPDGRQVCSVSYDCSLKTWDALSGKMLRSMKHTLAVLCCGWNTTGMIILSGSADSQLRFWCSSSGDLLHYVSLAFQNWDGDHRYAYCCAFSRCDEHILCGLNDYTLTLYAWDSVKVLAKKDQASTEPKSNGTIMILQHSLRGHHGSISACHFSPRGDTVLSASQDKTIRIWDRQNGRLLRTLRGHTAFVLDACFSSDGIMVFSLSATRLILWNTISGNIERVLEQSAAMSCDVCDDGTILTASAEGVIELWIVV
jgi:WD40 repeat protein